jgi:Amiloride-sensitive sodium channel
MSASGPGIEMGDGGTDAYRTVLVAPSSTATIQAAPSSTSAATPTVAPHGIHRVSSGSSWAKPRVADSSSLELADGGSPTRSSDPVDHEHHRKIPHSRAAARLSHTKEPPPPPPGINGGKWNNSWDPQNLPSFKERWTSFSSTTTAHGLYQAMDARYPRACRFTLWMLVTLAGIAVFAWATSQQYGDVGQYPVVIETNTTVSPTMDLPQVSICTFAESSWDPDPQVMLDAFVIDCYISKFTGSNFSCTPDTGYWQVLNSSWNTFGYSNCFTLFGIGSKLPPASAAFVSAGYKNSLEVVVDLSLGDSTRVIHSSFFDGVQVSIQPSTQFSLPMTGFTASPGSNTVIAISARTATRLNSPFNPETGGCSTDQRFTQEICQQLCNSFSIFNELAQKAAAAAAGTSNNDDDPTGGLPPSYYTNMTEADIAAGYTCPSQCQPACFQEDYSVSTSSRAATFAFEEYYCNDNLNRGLCLQNVTDPSEPCALDPDNDLCLPDPKQFANRVVSLTIYPATLSVSNMAETPKYQPWSIISGVGGNLGLMLGFSLLTVLEWAEFFLFGTCLYPLYARCLRSKPWSEY